MSKLSEKAPNGRRVEGGKVPPRHLMTQPSGSDTKIPNAQHPTGRGRGIKGLCRAEEVEGGGDAISGGGGEEGGGLTLYILSSPCVPPPSSSSGGSEALHLLLLLLHPSVMDPFHALRSGIAAAGREKGRGDQASDEEKDSTMILYSYVGAFCYK